MTTIKPLLDRVDKLERQSKTDGEFKIAEVNYPGDDFWPACKFALVRSGEPVFRFPQKLSPEEWQAKYSQPNP